MKNTGTLQVTTPTDREIAMTRVFDAPRRLVFDAHTKPELLKRWFGVFGGWSLVVCEIDLKVGGTYRYVWRGPDGRDMGMRGVYREIVPVERIVCTESFDDPWYEGEAVDTTVFVEHDGKTTLTTTMLCASKEARDTVSSPPWSMAWLRATTTLRSCWRRRWLRESNDNSNAKSTYASPSGRADGVNLKSREESYMQKITPFLWFDNNAEEAMNFYVSIFKNSKVLSVTRYGEAGPGPKGTVLTTAFQLDGQEFIALNGGPQFTFTEAISFSVDCKTQEEVDELWEKLSEGGEKSRCGWLKDKYGLSWQIVPAVLSKMLQDKDAEKAKRVMNAMLQMDKIDMKRLEQARDQG